MEESKFEKCKNCKYYQRHYVDMGLSFQPIGGHCMNKTLIASRHRDLYRLEPNCQYWEINTEVRQKKKEDIREIIKSMNEHLEHIVNILENTD